MKDSGVNQVKVSKLRIRFKGDLTKKEKKKKGSKKGEQADRQKKTKEETNEETKKGRK